MSETSKNSEINPARLGRIYETFQPRGGMKQPVGPFRIKSAVRPPKKAKQK